MNMRIARSTRTLGPPSVGWPSLSRRAHSKVVRVLRSCRAGRGCKLGRLIALHSSLVISLTGSAIADSNQSISESSPEHTLGRPAVLAPNLRVSARYAYSHADKARSTFRSNPTTTSVLEIEEADFNAATLEITATIPVTHRFGVRGSVRGGFTDREQDVDRFGLGHGRDSVSSYGVEADLFVRDPDRGSVAIGSSFNRLDAESGSDANEFGASAGASIFFPDLGSGHLDWTFRFDYAHQEVADQDDPTQSYTATAGAGWYLTENSQLMLGGRWSRIENDFVSEEDLEGFLKVRWLLPTPVPMELSLGGSAGVSDYKEAPFPNEDRLIYGASAGLTIRFRSGPTLIDMIRGYD